MKQATNNDLAARILEDRRLRALCTLDKPLTQGERRELVELGLAYFTGRNDGRSGSDMILTEMGRLAGRVGRLDVIVAERRA